MRVCRMQYHQHQLDDGRVADFSPSSSNQIAKGIFALRSSVEGRETRIMLSRQVSYNATFWFAFRVRMVLWTKVHSVNGLGLLRFHHNHGSFAPLFEQEMIDRML